MLIDIMFWIVLSTDEKSTGGFCSKTKISSLTNANTTSQVVAMSKSIQIEARTDGGS
jgi:hypothetical protein